MNRPPRHRCAAPGLCRIALACALLLSIAGCRTTDNHSERQLRHAGLVEVAEVVPDAVLDIRYATTDNFTGQAVYPSSRCFLNRDAAHALALVQKDLKSQGFRLKVFDGYRPLSVQRRFWAILPNPDFVADPAVGSRHNRGFAVDVSLVTLDGLEVPMPTAFDDFSERAHPDYPDIPEEAARNRAILRRAMERRGFTIFPTEWWHFDYAGWEDKPVLDIPIPK